MESLYFSLDENRTQNEFFGELKTVETVKFSDGEIFVNLPESVRGKRVYLFSSPNNSDEIMKLYLAVSAAKSLGAKEIIPVLPYFPYSRSDKRDNKRGAIGAKTVAMTLETLGSTSLITFELHADQIEGFFTIPIIHIKGRDVFHELFSSTNENDVVLCAPDAGAAKRVEYLIDSVKERYDIELSYVIMNKTRKTANVVDKMVLLGDVRDKIVYIYDDMVDTFGTADKAVNTLLENGAKSVKMLASHGILSGPAHERLVNSKLDELFVTNSLPQINNSKISVVSIDKQLFYAIYAIENGLSYESVNTSNKK
jgi:ribose-phosphate pyrophosphokinase